MNAKDVINRSWSMAVNFGSGLLEDMQSAPLARTCPEMGNHPYWILGHLVVSQAQLLDRYLSDKPNRHAEWMPKFGIGSAPPADMSGGPSYAELLSAWNDIKAATDAHIAGLTDADLDKLCCKVDEPGPEFDTVAECLGAMSLHLMFHSGQLADARRADGRKPMMF